MHRPDHVLTVAPVAHRPACPADTAGNGAFFHIGLGPDVLKQLFFGHQPVALLDQIKQQLIHLALHLDGCPCVAQLAPLRVDYVVSADFLLYR
jgi:hypothetical protein